MPSVELERKPMLAYYYHNLSPFLFEFSPGLGPRWYGIAYLAGFGIAYQLFIRWQRQGWLSLNIGLIPPFFTNVILGTLLGGRLGYCFFYDGTRTLAEPWTIFQVWKGGMSSHGGIIGLTLAAWIFAKRHKLSPWHLWDAIAAAAPLGLFLGRIANFINGELWGRPSQVPWAVIFPDSPLPLQPRHPSQLYEAILEGILLGIILGLVKKKTQIPGTVCATFLTAYPLLRIIGEQFREPDVQIGYWFGFLTQGQLLSFIMLGLSLGIWWKIKKMKTSLKGK